MGRIGRLTLIPGSRYKYSDNLQIVTDAVIHTKAQKTKTTTGEVLCGKSMAAKIAKTIKPIPPIVVPSASRATASLPRLPGRNPARTFFSFSCFSIRVAPAGKIAGNARNKPPSAAKEKPHGIFVPLGILQRSGRHLYLHRIAVSQRRKKLHRPKATGNHKAKHPTAVTVAE